MLTERIAFVGSFISPSKEEMEAFVVEHGGKAQNFVSDDTTLVVVGSYHTKPAKLMRAEELNQQGSGIRIASVEEFLTESGDLTVPVATKEEATSASLKLSPPDPETVDEDQVFTSRRARRDHERMTEALAILKIDERTGRAYHDDTIADITVPAEAVTVGTEDDNAPEPTRTASDVTRRELRKQTTKPDNHGVIAALTEAEESAALKLWMIPIACFVALAVSVMVNAEVMTFISVAMTLSSITLVTLFHAAQRNISGSGE
jgi:hypothetical protein